MELQKQTEMPPHETSPHETSPPLPAPQKNGDSLLDPLLVRLLCCPACLERPALYADEAAGGLRCASCGRTYPIKNGVPFLLAESGGSSGSGSSNTTT